MSGGSLYLRTIKFWMRVNKEHPSGCWMWIGAKGQNGYGAMRWGESMKAAKPVGAHRIAYELERGPVPEHMTIDHLCRTKLCVNPAHMEIVTLEENVSRARRLATQKANFS